MATRSTTPRPRVRRRRPLLRLLVVLLCIPLLLVLLWWLGNRIDASPSDEAIAFDTAQPRPVRDEDNAWLLLAGIGAAAGEDPIAHGRRRVSALEDWLRAAPGNAIESDAPESPDPVPLVGPDAALDRAAGYCPSRHVDCLEWAARHRPMLARLRAANALRLERYEHALALPDWQAATPPAMAQFFPDVSVAVLWSNLLALDLFHATTQRPDEVAPLLERLAAEVEFWRRVQAHPQDLFSTAVAGRRVEEAQRIAGAVMRRLPAQQEARAAAALDRILAPPRAPIDWSEAVRHEYRLFQRTIAAGVPGPWGALRQCWEGTADQGCVKGFLVSSAFARQATLNLHARHRVLMQRVMEAPPDQLDAVQAEVGRDYEQTFVRFDDTRAMLRQMAHNYTGRVLAQIAVPAFDYHLRLHDTEALRRMLVVEREARRNGIAAADMAAFLQGQPAPLRNPYDGTAFEWDPLFGEIRFAPRAARYWKQPWLEVAHPSATGVHACATPLLVSFTESVAGGGQADLRTVVCGRGYPSSWMVSGAGDEGIGSASDPLRRYYQVDVRRHGGQVAVRVLRDDGGTLHRHEAIIDAPGGLVAVDLAAVGDDDTPPLRAWIEPADDVDLVAVDVRNQSVREVARALAEARGLRITGVDGATQRITTHGDLGLHELLNQLADVAGARLHERGPGDYAFLR